MSVSVCLFVPLVTTRGEKTPKDDVIPYNFWRNYFTRLLDGNDQTYRPPEPSVGKISSCSCYLKKRALEHEILHTRPQYLSQNLKIP